MLLTKCPSFLLRRIAIDPVCELTAPIERSVFEVAFKRGEMSAFMHRAVPLLKFDLGIVAHDAAAIAENEPATIMARAQHRTTERG
jgi:hypothetical protein